MNISHLENLSYDDHMDLYLFLLRTIGVGFIDNKYYGPRYLLSIYFNTMLLFIILSETIFIWGHYTDTSKTTECLTTLFLGLALYVKFSIIKVYRMELRIMIDEMKSVYDKAKADGGLHWEVMCKKMKEARVVTRFCLLFCVSL